MQRNPELLKVLCRVHDTHVSFLLKGFDIWFLGIPRKLFIFQSLQVSAK